MAVRIPFHQNSQQNDYIARHTHLCFQANKSSELYLVPDPTLSSHKLNQHFSCRETGRAGMSLGHTTESLELVKCCDFVGPPGSGAPLAQPFQVEVEAQVNRRHSAWASQLANTLFCVVLPTRYSSKGGHSSSQHTVSSAATCACYSSHLLTAHGHCCKTLPQSSTAQSLREPTSCLRGYLNPKYSLLSCTKTSSNTYLTFGEDMCWFDHESLMHQ